MITIRPMREEDLEAARLLWSDAEGVHLSAGDSVNELKGYLARNAATSHVACDGDKLVGAVLAGHDGRRGFIYHLAVKSSHQRAGVGKRLVDHCLTALRARQVVRVLLLVAQNNENGKTFWKKCGWESLDYAQPMGIDLI